MNTLADIFTAAQLSKALGVRRQSIYARFKGIQPAGQVAIGGMLVAGWSFDGMPQTLKTALESRAKRLGYRDVIELIRHPHQRWEPENIIFELAPVELARASQLRDALADSLGRIEDPLIKRVELENRGMTDYRRTFGHSISAAYWRRLFHRTIDRDRGRKEWYRIELYLSERPALKAQGRPELAHETIVEFDDVRKFIASFHNQSGPTVTEKSHLWQLVCKCFESRLGHQPVSQIRHQLLAFLFKYAPFLAGSQPALRRKFERKFERWVTGGRNLDALFDGRSKPKKWALTQQDKDTLVYITRFNCGGCVSQGWRECLRKSELSEPVLRRYAHNPASKRHVPTSIRKAISREIARLAGEMNGAITRSCPS